MTARGAGGRRRGGALTVGRLARAHRLSRTALLYYDAIGLLSPGGRSAGGYRQYSEADARRLGQICRLRAAGLRLREIRQVLDAPGNALTRALEERLEELNGEISRLREQQRFILGLLRSDRAHARIRVMSKGLWTELLAASGLGEEEGLRWHAGFERADPARHQQFLEFLCLPAPEIAAIRARARAAGPSSPRAGEPEGGEGQAAKDS